MVVTMTNASRSLDVGALRTGLGFGLAGSGHVESVWGTNRDSPYRNVADWSRNRACLCLARDATRGR